MGAQQSLLPPLPPAPKQSLLEQEIKLSELAERMPTRLGEALVVVLDFYAEKTSDGVRATKTVTMRYWKVGEREARIRSKQFDAIGNEFLNVHLEKLTKQGKILLDERVYARGATTLDAMLSGEEKLVDKTRWTFVVIGKSAAHEDDERIVKCKQ